MDCDDLKLSSVLDATLYGSIEVDMILGLMLLFDCFWLREYTNSPIARASTKPPTTQPIAIPTRDLLPPSFGLA